MTTTQTNPAARPANGTTPKNTRTRKPVTARTMANKIAEMLEKIPAEQRDKVLALAKTLVDAGV